MHKLMSIAAKLIFFYSVYGKNKSAILRFNDYFSIRPSISPGKRWIGCFKRILKLSHLASNNISIYLFII